MREQVKKKERVRRFEKRERAGKEAERMKAREERGDGRREGAVISCL